MKKNKLYINPILWFAASSYSFVLLYINPILWFGDEAVCSDEYKIFPRWRLREIMFISYFIIKHIYRKEHISSMRLTKNPYACNFDRSHLTTQSHLKSSLSSLVTKLPLGRSPSRIVVWMCNCQAR